MPNRDRFHYGVRRALEKDGWLITDDPLRLRWGKQDMYVDLAAEKLLLAEKDQLQIAVEIKTFGGPSSIADAQKSLGQYFIYLSVIKRLEPQRKLYLALHEEVYEDFFTEPLGEIILSDYKVPIIVFDPDREVIIRWID
ncbi:MAG: fatty-acid synthase [Moorea sp. SIO1F2]|uniref:element excision factor XisH family protein n=1 Tax=unclassified Moorena TaxID=2683338 RepID=UPI0013B7852A|nr:MULTISPECIES: element excision factor XisH family protein [unclassified Moorena]NEN98791.1 fatty-acid synthase [Moorena sp. SIO3I7]NEO66657.1 fatty-acid synthase [Moorena sp. SIO4G2]NEO09009.1 fatty-acid synthase [Moorena sp. SIO3I8]NEO22463.1 fatty-acid synthase [Moorena sp. SIO4A5]NEP23907.1 fatty-acid synthase [Moorena sp. SIO3I6]